jgi:hypothetical protein
MEPELKPHHNPIPKPQPELKPHINDAAHKH